MGGERQDDTQRNEADQDQAAGKQPQGGGKIDDQTSKAQEDAAKERAENGGYQ